MLFSNELITFHRNSPLSSTNFLEKFYPFSQWSWPEKAAESGKINVASCMVDFEDIQFWIWQVILNLIACKVLTVFLIFFTPKFEEDCQKFPEFKIQDEQSWSNLYFFEIENANAKMIFSGSANFQHINKPRVENRLWGKGEFLCVGKLRHYYTQRVWKPSSQVSLPVTPPPPEVARAKTIEIPLFPDSVRCLKSMKNRVGWRKSSKVIANETYERAKISLTMPRGLQKQI